MQFLLPVVLVLATGSSVYYYTISNQGAGAIPCIVSADSPTPSPTSASPRPSPSPTKPCSGTCSVDPAPRDIPPYPVKGAADTLSYLNSTQPDFTKLEDGYLDSIFNGNFNDFYKKNYNSVTEAQTAAQTLLDKKIADLKSQLTAKTLEVVQNGAHTAAEYFNVALERRQDYFGPTATKTTNVSKKYPVNYNFSGSVALANGLSGNASASAQISHNFISPNITLAAAYQCDLFGQASGYVSMTGRVSGSINANIPVVVLGTVVNIGLSASIDSTDKKLALNAAWKF